MSASDQAELLPAHTPALFEAAVRRAAQLLRAGELVAVPTETVYGLAANALNQNAVAKIYQVKNRPPTNPIIVHVASFKMARDCVKDWPRPAEALATAFWPGPLTLVLPRSRKIPEIVTAGGPTIGVRWPNHPFIQALILACDFPLAAPSANLSAAVSPTTAEHVVKSLGDRIPLIVDGGPAQVGIESTVLDLTISPPRLLRPGMIHTESLLAVTGRLTLGFGDSEAVLRSPGQLPKHYAPKAKLIQLAWKDANDLARRLKTLNAPLAATHIITHTQIPSAEYFGRVSILPHEPQAFASALYSELHRCDEAGARLIVVEKVPDQPAWTAIADRLRRAAV